MSASRSPWCSRPTLTSPRMPPSWCSPRSTSWSPASTPPAEPGAFLPGVSTEAAIVEKAYGDLAGAFARAHAVVALRLAVGRHSGVPLETRGAIARYDAARGLLELHGAAKIPHINRRAIAGMLGLPLERIHLYEGHVGGGFGIRGELYPEDVLACLAALRLQRPVKWIEDRREHLLAANHARDQVHEIRAAVDAQRLHPRHRRRVLDRSGRLCPHPCGDRHGSHRGDPAGPLRSAGLSLARPHPPHQQDAMRHLSGARPLRGHFCARTADRCDRGPARPRPAGGPPGQPDRPGRDAVRARRRRARHRGRLRFRRLSGAARAPARAHRP